jgi:hypothetical protein
VTKEQSAPDRDRTGSKQRAAEARARLAAQQRRQRLLRVGAAVGAVVAVVATLLVVKLVTGGAKPKSGQQAAAAPSGVIAKVTSVPAATLDAVAAGTSNRPPQRIDAPPLTAGGKPRLVYVGAEYCPYCAAERWAVVVALSRFGTFTGLGQTASSPSDVFPNTATLTFHGSSFSSDYLSLTAKEVQSNQVKDGQYTPLDTLSAEDEAVVKKYDGPPYVQSSGGIPVMILGGRFLISGASYDPGVLQGKTHQQIADALADPNSPIAKNIDGTANLITAAVCELTGNKPGAVCASSGVTAAAALLK